MKSAVWDDTELALIKNADRILPSQRTNRKMYKGETFYIDLENLLGSMHTAPQWEIETKPGVSYAVLGSDINTLRFYQFLIRLNHYQNILELGTYIGVSALYMAEAVGKTGFVTTIELGREFHWIANRNITKNKMQTRVRQLCMDAVEFVRNGVAPYFRQEMYDFILIDCAKESYRELLELSIGRLSPGGMILVDDVFFQGDTLNDEPTTEKGKGVRRCLDYAMTLTEWEKVILPIGNGLLMLRKL